MAFDADGTLWRGDVGEDLLRYLIAEDRLPAHPGARGLYAEYEARVEQDPAQGYAFAVEVMEGMEERILEAICLDFFHRRYRGRVFPFVRPLLQALVAAGYAPWIVSASPRWIVEAGAAELGLPPGRVIAVDCEVEAGLLTREVKRPVPCGAGKVALLSQRGLKPAFAAGNGELDQPMLEHADAALVIAPHSDPGNGLVRAALEKGWSVQRG